MQKTKLKLILLFAIVFIAALSAGLFSLLHVAAYAEDASYGYYYSQLTSAESKAFYKALADMKEEDVLKTGTETWDMVEKGYLSNKEYDQSVLTAAFGAGRDAFMLDNADLFYVDFDNLSLRQLTDGTSYRVTLGIGREESYLADGFTTETVGDAITAFEAKVSTIAEAAGAQSGIYNKILYVYETIMDNAIYTLEFDAGDDADYVRCAYGVMVKGKGVCQSFAQAVKTVLDRLGITNVVVEGTYIDDDGAEQPHMWNYVQMDDNRWYILDATMDNSWRDSGTADSLRYFLMNGTDAAGLYVPYGVISSSGFEFEYPTLCMVGYTAPSGNFTIETATNENNVEYQKVSYRGLGLRAAEAQGYYILFTYDVNGETGWMYAGSYVDYYILSNYDIDIDDYDFDTYFNSRLLLAGTSCIYAVTTDAPSDTTLVNYVYYSGSNIVEKSNAVIYDESETNPYAVSVSPDCLRFYIGSSYTVTITFNDNLVKVDESADITLTYSVPGDVTLTNPDGVISGIVWDESSPSQITFTFTPDKNYSADRCNYTFIVGNLVGESSGKTPAATILTALYKPSFSCPADPLSYCTAVASVPTLITDSDLSVEGWTYTDSDGAEQTVTNSSLSNKISLVATTYSTEDNAAYQGAVEDYNSANGADTQILSSATYDLSLNLCDVQVNYLNGEKVMVMVPFPDGYSADSAGVSFKAYHFADDGSVEEIDCYCTEYGIILFCSSFSAYTVAAVSGEAAEKTVLVTSEGHGSVSGGNLIKVESGGTLTLDIAADGNYCIDSITVNGTAISLNGAAEYQYTLSYDELDGNTTIVVKFAASSVVESELSAGFALASATPVENSGMSVLIIALVVAALVLLVAVVVACVVLIKKRNK